MTDTDSLSKKESIASQNTAMVTSDKDNNENTMESKFDKIVTQLNENMRFINSHFRSALDYTPCSTDIFINSWMKSGTTLMQNLFYQLMVATNRVPSDPTGTKFRDISEVVPYIEMSSVCGVYDSIHPYTPKVWKTHWQVTEFLRNKEGYKQGRFVYCIRDGRQVARSFLDFVYGWILKEFKVEEESLEQFYHYYVNKFFIGAIKGGDGKWVWDRDQQKDRVIPNWALHVKGWLDATEDLPNVFFILYEDLVTDMEKGVKSLADFVGIEITDEQVQFVVDKCDRKKMAGDTRFNDIMVSEGMNLDVTGGRRARPENEIGFAKYKLSDECMALYDDMFEQVFKVKTYEELVKQIRKRNDEFRQKRGF